MRRLLFVLAGLVPLLLFPQARLVRQPRSSAASSRITLLLIAGPGSTGSLTFGIEMPLVIAASATIDSAVATNLPMLPSMAPTCLTVTTDADGNITALAFASEGEVCGLVVFDATNDIYVVAGRIGTPSFVLDATPALAALFRTAEASGNHLCLTALVDSSGFFQGYRGHTAVSGPVASGGGQALIEGAPLAQALISPNAVGRQNFDRPDLAASSA